MFATTSHSGAGNASFYLPQRVIQSRAWMQTRIERRSIIENNRLITNKVWVSVSAERTLEIPFATRVKRIKHYCGRLYM